MKRILLFNILVLLSFQVYGNNQTQEKENQIGEKLKVDVKFTLPKEVIKYVVYAENKGIREDSLNLPDFILSQDPSKAGFVEAPPKVYTKRIVNGEIQDLALTDKITYILTHKDGFMPTVLNDTIKQGSTSYRQITSYLPKATLEEIIRGSKIKDYSVTEKGVIIKNGTNPLQAYFPAAQINMYNNNGVLETASPSNKYHYSIPQEDIEKIERYVGSGKALGNVSLKVKVE